jgi:hypothetical protein
LPIVNDERIRFYALAMLYEVDPGALLNACRRAGIAIMNQLSNVDLDQRRAIEALIDRGDLGPPLDPVPAPIHPKPRPIRAAAKPNQTQTNQKEA